MDRHLRHWRLHLRLHARLSTHRGATTHRERSALALAHKIARHLLRQPDRGGRMVHGTRSAVAAAVRVRVAKRTLARGRAALHQAEHGGKNAPAARYPGVRYAQKRAKTR